MSMALTGRLIVIEGSDGSGKATQSTILLRRLRANGLPVVRIAFPRYRGSFFGAMAAQYLRGEFGGPKAVHPCLAALLYAGDRWEARDEIIVRLQRGQIVICDRYVDSNKAHQAARLPPGERRKFLRWVDRLEYGLLRLPRPDFTIFLHVPHAQAERLIVRKRRRAYLRGRRRDMHEADPSHLRNAERIYLSLAMARSTRKGALIRCVEGGRLLSIGEVAERVWKALERRKLLRGLKHVAR